MLLTVIIKKQYLILLSALIALITLFVSAFSYREYPPLENTLISGEVIQIADGYVVLGNTSLSSGETSSACGKIYVYTGDELAVGDLISLCGDYIPVTDIPQNPGEIDSRYSNLARNISYSVRAGKITYNGHTEDIYTFFDNIRTSIYARLGLIMKDSDTLISLYSMLTGDKSHIDDFLYSLYSSAGVSHLLAVSGFHISLLLGIITYILDKLKLKGMWKITPIICFLIFYMMLTGFSPSVVRAGIMALAAVFASSFGFRYDPLNMLSFAGTVILLFSPFELFDVSFQLSFCACFGIIAYYKHFNGVFGVILSPILITVSATVATLPVVLYHFAEFSAITVIANLVIVPITSLAMILLVIAIVPVMISRYLLPLAYPAYFAELVVIKLLRFLAPIPTVTFPINNGYISLFLIASIVICSKYVQPEKVPKKLISLLLIVCISVLSFCDIARRSSRAEIRVLYTDNNSLCVHIHQKYDYIIGYSASYQEKEYISRNFQNVDGAFILCMDDYNNFHDSYVWRQYGFAENFYSASGYDSLGALCYEHCFEDEEFTIDKSTFLLSDQGMIYSYMGKTVFIGANDQPLKCENDVDVNISPFYVTDAPINITCSDNDEFDYSTQKSGCITVYISNSGIKVRPFHEVIE